MDCVNYRTYKTFKRTERTKIVTLVTAGSASTLILTVSFIQNIRFGIDSDIYNYQNMYK